MNRQQDGRVQRPGRIRPASCEQILHFIVSQFPACIRILFQELYLLRYVCPQMMLGYPCAYPGDERRQLPPQAESPKTHLIVRALNDTRARYRRAVGVVRARVQVGLFPDNSLIVRDSTTDIPNLSLKKVGQVTWQQRISPPRPPNLRALVARRQMSEQFFPP